VEARSRVSLCAQGLCGRECSGALPKDFENASDRWWVDHEVRASALKAGNLVNLSSAPLPKELHLLVREYLYCACIEHVHMRATHIVVRATLS
jgi:hypothetical protein